VRAQTSKVTIKSNPHEKIGATGGQVCPDDAESNKQIAEGKGRGDKTRPIQSKIFESNFKTGAINRSATPPGISDQ